MPAEPKREAPTTQHGQDNPEPKRPIRRTVVWRISRRKLMARAALLGGAVLALVLAVFLVKTLSPKRTAFRDGPRYVPSILPVSLKTGWVSSEFGMRIDPITGQKRMHRGIDLAVDEGVPVRAAADGRVVFAGQGGDYGKLVRLDHGNGIETRYAHNSALKVEDGDLVRRGRVIALAGHTGRVKGNPGDHLHYEVWVKGQPVSPRKYLPHKIVEGKKPPRPGTK